ncbi:unnamed protein product, partial [Ectocarpus sp. 12 AP-2014]
HQYFQNSVGSTYAYTKQISSCDTVRISFLQTILARCRQSPPSCKTNSLTVTFQQISFQRTSARSTHDTHTKESFTAKLNAIHERRIFNRDHSRIRRHRHLKTRSKILPRGDG